MERRRDLLFGNTYTLGSGSTATFKFVTTVIAWTTGSYDQECTFTLTCSSFTVGPHEGAWTDARTTYAAEVGDTCTLSLADTYGDGWNGAAISVFGNTYTLPYGVSSEDFSLTISE